MALPRWIVRSVTLHLEVEMGREGRAAIVIDDVLPPWRPRGIEVRGRAEVLASGGEAFGRGWAAEIIRIWPNKVRV